MSLWAQDVGAAGTATIVGLVFTVVVGPLVGSLVWMVRQMVAKTIPEIQQSNNAALDRMRDTFERAIATVVSKYEDNLRYEREQANRQFNEAMSIASRGVSLLQEHHSLAQAFIQEQHQKKTSTKS